MPRNPVRVPPPLATIIIANLAVIVLVVGLCSNATHVDSAIIAFLKEFLHAPY